MTRPKPRLITKTEGGTSDRVSPAAAGLALSTLLSQVLVAFTIEFDNEFEHQMPHRTTSFGASASLRQGPWLVSLVMWSNCMQFVGEGSVPVRELENLARTKTNLNGMERLGYVVVAPDPADTRPKPPRFAWLIRATAKGQKAQQMWRLLFGAIEKRWENRFGAGEIGALRNALAELLAQIDLDLPECLPILGYGLFGKGPDRKPARKKGARNPNPATFSLAALLAQVLLAFALEFERESELSLAISANVLRVLARNGTLLRDLPRLSGVSKEAIGMALGILEKKRAVTIGTDAAGSRAKVVRLTAAGRKLQDACQKLISEIEARWRARFGDEKIRALRSLLERLVGSSNMNSSPLSVGLEPYPEGWRAAVRKPETLPHFPMVLHRGGFPDGS